MLSKVNKTILILQFSVEIFDLLNHLDLYSVMHMIQKLNILSIYIYITQYSKYYSLRMQVRTKTSQTEYGSQLLLGLLSSR